MIAPTDPDDLERVKAWFRRLSEHVQAVDFAGARPLFADDMIAFGTFENFITGRDAAVLADRLLRDGRPFHAHEVLEAAWKAGPPGERDLWQGGAITPGTKAFSTELVGNVGKLNGIVASLQYKPEDLANGASDLAEEIQNTKITGEEEAFSHIDLVDFSGNVEGAQQAYASLRPGLEKIDATLVHQIDQQFQSVLATLDGYRDPAALGGYKTYTPALKASDATKLTAVIEPLHQSLSTVAQKVVTAG